MALWDSGIVGIDRDEAPLGLGDHLLRHHEDVAVEQRAVGRRLAGVGDEVGEHVAGPDLADALHRPELEAAHDRPDPAAIVAVASRAATSGVLITVDVTRQCRPSASTDET